MMLARSLLAWGSVLILGLGALSGAQELAPSQGAIDSGFRAEEPKRLQPRIVSGVAPASKEIAQFRRFGEDQEACPDTITLNESETIDVGGILCLGGGVDNAWARSYNFVSLQPGSFFELQCVEFACYNSGDPVVAVVTVYLDTDGGDPQAPGVDLEVLATKIGWLETSGTRVMQVGFDEPICIAPESTIVVSFSIPESSLGTQSGTYAAFSGYYGSGDKTWILSESCGVYEYQQLSDLGFTNEMWQVLRGTIGTCGTNACESCDPDGFSLDCNENGIDDLDDIANGTSQDCDGNLLPDECQADCDGDGVPDVCAVEQADAMDCDDNLIPDNCQIADAPELDCNGNGMLDICEISVGLGYDLNNNDVLDCCEDPRLACGPDAADVMDFATWLDYSPILASPPGRIGHVFCNRVLFGGENEDGLLLGDTWQLGLEWEQIIGEAPSPRTGAAMALANTTDTYELVLFGGASDQGVLGGTWTFDDSIWRLEQPKGPAPSPRMNHAMSRDVATDFVVLFGGRTGEGGALLADTWRWGGTQWVQASPPESPTARYGHRLVYDAFFRRVILQGGIGSDEKGDIALSDTWAWNGESWTQLLTSGGPAGTEFDMAYSETLRGVLAVSGAQAWLFRGGVWSELPIGKLVPSTGVPAPGARLIDSYYGGAWSFGGFAPEDPGGLMLSCSRDRIVDCDSDGLIDGLAARSGVVEDCNENGIPDSCEDLDCDFDGVLDVCTLEGVQRADDDSTWYSWGFIGSLLQDTLYFNSLPITEETERVDSLWIYWDDFASFKQEDVKLCIWSDPDGDQLPYDAQLIWYSIVDLPELADEWLHFALPELEIGEAGGVVFAGFIVTNDPDDGIDSYAGTSTNNRTAIGMHSWISASTEQSIDVFDIAGSSNYGPLRVNTAINVKDYAWLIRIGRRSELDTDANMVLDVCECVGDIDFDGVVSGSDLTALLASWGACVEGAPCLGDLNEDLNVNGADLTLLLGAWGPCSN